MLRTAFVLFFVLFAVAACSNSANNDENNNNNNDNNNQNNSEASGEGNPIVTITMEDGSEIKAELYPDVAPNTVNNFISLAQDGYYDGIIFHRVIPGFMINGGDPEVVGSVGPGYAIISTFSTHDFETELVCDRYVYS